MARLGFIGAMGSAVLWLVYGLSSRASSVARVAAIVFVLLYGAYETWTGIATGALTAGAHDLPAGEQTGGPELIQAHWDSARLGNGSVGAIIGSAAWPVATAAAGLALRGRGAPHLEPVSPPRDDLAVLAAADHRGELVEASGSVGSRVGDGDCRAGEIPTGG